MPRIESIPPSALVVGCNGDFSTFLCKELERRRKNNPRYSLRAFAKFLGIHSANLARMMRNERPTSPEFIGRIGERLGLTAEEIEVFCSIAEAHKSVNVVAKRSRKSRYVPLAQDIFEAIEDWRHYAILELIKLKSFQNNAGWVAFALKIPVSEAQVYLDRLLRVGLLEVLPDGSWHDRSSESMAVLMNDFETTEPLRRVQRSFLDLAIESLEKDPIDQRDHSSILMATHSSRIAGAKKIISKSVREVCAFLEDCKEKDSVYSLTTSLSPLAKPKKGQSK